MDRFSETKIDLKREEEERKLLAARDLAREIKRLREELRWTQGELAEKVGVSQPVISDMELGRYNFPLDSILRLARAFNKSPYEFIAIYFGEDPTQFTSPERELLNNIIGLVDQYKGSLDQPVELSTRRQHSEKTRAGIERARASTRAHTEEEKKKRANQDNNSKQQPQNSVKPPEDNK